MIDVKKEMIGAVIRMDKTKGTKEILDNELRDMGKTQMPRCLQDDKIIYVS
jgi:hypothetical protein